VNQDDLNKYFTKYWHSRIDSYKFSGWGLIDKINPNESVLDVGCGRNPFKGKIINLVGIDPAFNEADVKIPIEYFSTDKNNQFDVAFCLGSINFGDEATVLNQISHVIRLLKPIARIYWRCNPGHFDHGNDECKNIDFYPWTIEKHIELAEQFGFRLAVACWDTNNRIYAEWHR
jgi:hypothetical protein